MFLGAAESGKSTLCRQIRILHGCKFSDEEILRFKHHIRVSCLKHFIAIIKDYLEDTENTLKHENEPPLRSSCITGLFIVNLMLSSLFDEGLFAIGMILVFLTIKGPLIVIWTNHRQKQKSLKKKQQVERSFSAQAQFSQLESHAVNELL